MRSQKAIESRICNIYFNNLTYSICHLHSQASQHSPPAAHTRYDAHKRQLKLCSWFNILSNGMLSSHFHYILQLSKAPEHQSILNGTGFRLNCAVCVLPPLVTVPTKNASDIPLFMITFCSLVIKVTWNDSRAAMNKTNHSAVFLCRRARLINTRIPVNIDDCAF